MTSQHHIFRADSATYVGEPEDGFESECVDWIPLAQIRALIDERDIVAATTLVALLYVLATEGA